MLNNLNSVLIEGKFRSGGGTRPDGVFAFTVESHRAYKKGEETKEEIFFFNIETSGRLAEICAEYLRDGRGVRIVGQIRQELRPDENGYARSYVLIKAEHVEFKAERSSTLAEVNARRGHEEEVR